MFIDQERLLKVLRNSLKQTTVTQMFETEIASLERSSQGNKLNMLLSNGELLESQFLVAAEGGQSKVAQLVDARRYGWSHNQRAIVANLEW